jgi:hypothetical protein
VRGIRYHLQPESSAAANERTMDAEVNQALELIRQRSPQILLGTITNIYERGIVDYLIRFALDQSNPRKLWQTVRNAAIDQLGIGVTTEQIDTNQTFSLTMSPNTIFLNSPIRK